MKILCTVLMLFVLSLTVGCAQQLHQFATKSASVADSALSASEWGVCTAATVGSVRRAYGTSPEKAKAWQTFCAQPTNIIPITTVEEATRMGIMENGHER